MFSSERTQNGVVSFVIIVAVVSSLFFVNNVQYYYGSFSLASTMEVNVVKITVVNIDPTNDSIYPILAFTINFRTNTTYEGNVRLTALYGSIWLNDDFLSFTSLSTAITSDSDQLLTPGYDKNFTLGKTINARADRTTILDANSTDTWSWFIRFRYSFMTFDESNTLTTRVRYFNWTWTPTIL